MVLRIPFSLALYAFTTSTIAQSISPATSPNGASGYLSPSFAGFGIEPSNLFSFTGASSANTLSVNLLKNLAGYSGLPPHLRIGGNTADYMVYQSSYSSYSVESNADASGAGAYASNSLIFGPSYFKALDRFPEGTPITFGLNLAYEATDYISSIVTEAQAVLDNLKNTYLYSFEIGNEPDLYGQNGFRTGTWDGSVYVQEYLARASAVYEQVLKPAGMSAKFFESPCTASTIGTTFEIDLLVSDGIMQGTNGSGNFISGWNQHDYFYFVSVSTYDITLAHLMELKATEDQFSYWATQVKAGLATGLPYYLREMASVGPTGLPGISDTFGAALWTFNFFCYTATLNISSVEMHMTDNSFASAWAPIAQEGITGKQFAITKGVRPSYYAFAAMYQLIGSGNGTTQIAATTLSNLPSGYADYVRSYSVYTQGALSAIVIINGQQANASDTSKGGVTFSLSNLPTDGSKLYVSELTADGADSTAGTTWNGISFEQDTTGTPSTVNKTIASYAISSSGTASVYVRDSQAIICNIGYQLGTHAVVVADGTATSSKKPSAASSTTGQGANAAVYMSLLTTAFFVVLGYPLY